MNFLLRNTQLATPELAAISEIEPPKDVQKMPKPAMTLAGLIAEDQSTNSSASYDGDKDSDGIGDAGVAVVGSIPVSQLPSGKHSAVAEDEGWITIPHKELPEDWNGASSISQLRSFDRSFVFPGEQLHILVCLKATKQDAEVITPFKIAAAISKNGNSAQNFKHQMDMSDNQSSSNGVQAETNCTCEGAPDQGLEDKNDESMSTREKMDPEQDISATESLLRMEDHKQRTETLVKRFRNSNFFVRIAESDELLWSKRSAPKPSSMDYEMEACKSQTNDSGSRKTSRSKLLNAVIDRGIFDGNMSGGVARNSVSCFSLSNGDIVVLLQVNVADNSMKDPVLEVLQFEKYKDSCNSENLNGFPDDPYHELLSWLIPVDRTLPPPRLISPPISSASVLASPSHKAYSVSSGSQIFSFGHFRSLSMPSFPQTTPSAAVTSSNVKSSFDLEDFDRCLPNKLTKSRDTGNGELLSFRGVPLEPERFSVHCGLEGMYLPGRRWQRKLEIIQPIEITSFSADCITEDLLCVQIKNVSPAHIPDIVIFLDAITIVFEEASKGGPPLSLPIASIETGNDHSLPNLALRRGEEHSFILKPTIAQCRDQGPSNTSSRLSHSKMGGVGGPSQNMHPAPRVDGRRVSSSTDQYAVLISCRCNYSESKLFFKHPTNWCPSVARDLMISVASEMSKQTVGLNEQVPQLPVQVLTLQASNLTSEDLTLTVVAHSSSNSSPSILSLSSGPTTPMSPFVGFPEFWGRVGVHKHGSSVQRLKSMPTVPVSWKESYAKEKRSVSLGARTCSTSDVISSSNLGCTHLCLQSTVPLGCVPARSSSTVKLELLPLTDGIITLDTLQIAVKEKGQMYTPEQPLKIHVTSSLATGMM